MQVDKEMECKGDLLKVDKTNVKNNRNSEMNTNAESMAE